MSVLLYKLLTAVMVFILTINVVRCAECVMASSCSCKYIDGRVIDLSPLDGGKDKHTLKATDKDNNVYYYNPCTNFDKQVGCKNVSLCQFANGLNYYSFGTQESAIFRSKEEGVYIEYQGTDKLNTTRKSLVKLVCTKSEQKDPLVASGETAVGSREYNFILSSPHCCPTDKSGASPKSPLSVGIIVLVIGLMSCVVW